MPRKRKQKCPQCGKSFKLLESHITRIHPMQQTASTNTTMSDYDIGYSQGKRVGAEIATKEFTEKNRSEIFQRKLQMMEYASHAIDAAAHAIRSIAEVK
jgi:hypothetical protein